MLVGGWKQGVKIIAYYADWKINEISFILLNNPLKVIIERYTAFYAGGDTTPVLKIQIKHF